MNTQKGVIHIALILLPLLLIGVGIFLASKFGLIKLPSFNVLEKKASVELKQEYKNPFKKETQYINPFKEYKNPFVTN